MTAERNLSDTRIQAVGGMLIHATIRESLWISPKGIRWGGDLRRSGGAVEPVPAGLIRGDACIFAQRPRFSGISGAMNSPGPPRPSWRP